MNKRLALVTGSSRGIGSAIATRLAADGYDVIGTATTDAGVRSAEERMRPFGSSHRFLRLDFSDADPVSAVAETIRNLSGKMPDILINNAGITEDSLLIRMDEGKWDDIMQVNLKSVFLLSKACLRDMIKSRFGRIISVTSVVGFTGNPGQTNYAAAKAAIAGFSRSLAREVGRRGVTVNTVAPGFIDTDMTGSLKLEQRAQLIGNIPLGRLGTAEDVAGAVSFLASDAAAYITGQTLHVNGGMFMQ